MLVYTFLNHLYALRAKLFLWEQTSKKMFHGFRLTFHSNMFQKVNTAENITLTPFSISSTTLPGQQIQLRVNLLICLSKHWNQVLGLPTVIWGKECIRCPRWIAAASATDAVDVIFRGVWIIKVDHIFDPIHICVLNNMFACLKQYEWATSPTHLRHC